MRSSMNEIVLTDEENESESFDDIEMYKIGYSSDGLNVGGCLAKPKIIEETEHFIIYYTETDLTCIGKVSYILEDSYNRITSIFNQKLEEKLIVEIHPEHKELLKALGFPNGPKWVRGGIGNSKILIASPLNPPYGSDFNGVVNTAVHEFVHIIISKINNNLPRWLDEGIASYEAKDNNENWIRRTVAEGLHNNNLPAFQDLDTGDDFETFFNRDGYQYSYTIVESIVEEFGYDKLNDFIKSPNRCLDILGIKEIHLREKWVDFIRERYGASRHIDGTKCISENIDSVVKKYLETNKS